MIHEIAQVLVEAGRKIQTANERPSDGSYQSKLQEIDEEVKLKISLILSKQK